MTDFFDIQSGTTQLQPQTMQSGTTEPAQIGRRRVRRATGGKRGRPRVQRDGQGAPAPRVRQAQNSSFDVTQALMLGSSLDKDEAVFLGSIAKMLQACEPTARRRVIEALGKLFP